jgi:hypothetical protein
MLIEREEEFLEKRQSNFDKYLSRFSAEKEALGMRNEELEQRLV